MNISLPGPVSKPHVFFDRPVMPTDEDLDDDGLPDDLDDMTAKDWDRMKGWFPEQEPFEDEFLLEKKRAELPDLVSILPSEFTEFAFRMPKKDGMGYENFTFEGRRHMRDIYDTPGRRAITNDNDTPARRILLFCGRQVEKSTLLGNTALCYSCLVPSFKTLYVSPSATQTKTFSSDRIKEPIETSPVLKSYTTSMLSQNVFEKQFVNRSKITLRYSFLNADRTRGIPAWMLMLDELQDILHDNIPIIEQCLSHAPENWKTFVYAGTPKTLDNTIEFYWSGVTKHGHSMSTQHQWVVPCDCRAGEGGRFWNILGEKNIGKKGLSCERCSKLINPMTEDAQWAWMVEDAVFEGYRIPQLMVPWRSWDEILLDYGRYERPKFYNEVLGLSSDSGMRPLTMQNIKDCCNPKVSMHPKHLEMYQARSVSEEVFAGIDWGTGENTYTVLSLGMYFDGKFRIFYIHRFIGEDLDPDIQIEKIVEILSAFNVIKIGADYGGGYIQNRRLVQRFGPQPGGRVATYQYMARTKKKLEFDTKLGRFKVHRTEVMSDIFNAIKRRKIDFPRWEEFKEPFGGDMLNIFSEYNETLRMVQYDSSVGKPDDSFHSVLYCFLASMLVKPRPDILIPKREVDQIGPIYSMYDGPKYQG